MVFVVSMDDATLRAYDNNPDTREVITSLMLMSIRNNKTVDSCVSRGTLSWIGVSVRTYRKIHTITIREIDRIFGGIPIGDLSREALRDLLSV